MRSRLVATYVALATLVLALLAVPLGVTFARFERNQLRQEVLHDALVLAALSEERLETGAPTDVQALADDYQRRVGARVVIVDRSGLAIADSAPAAGEPRSFASRPEITEALAGREAIGTRYSQTLGGVLLYVAVPVASEGRIYGAVRITYPTGLVDARIRRTWLALAGSALVILLLAAAASLLLARSFIRPLRELGRTAERVGHGDLSARAPVPRQLPEIRAVAEVLNETVATLDALLRSQREFVADASHQLRSPLAALRLRLENLEQEAGPSANLTAAVAEVQRLSRLVDALLQLARSDAAARERVPVDVAAAVRERVAIWEPYFAERGVLLAAETVPARALGTPGHLDQVLDNLLANAADASPRNGLVTVTVTVSAGLVEVHVADQGPGLTGEERARAFDRFWRGPGRTTGGSGLGLAIVRQLVRSDGGDVTLQPVAPHGLAARVRLPAITTERATDGSLAPPPA